MAATERTDAEFFFRRVSEMEDRELPSIKAPDPYVFARNKYDRRSTRSKTIESGEQG